MDTFNATDLEWFFECCRTHLSKSISTRGMESAERLHRAGFVVMTGFQAKKRFIPTRKGLLLYQKLVDLFMSEVRDNSLTPSAWIDSVTDAVLDGTLKPKLKKAPR